MKVILDIEADNLLQDITKVWCIVLKPIPTDGEASSSTHFDVFVPRHELRDDLDVKSLLGLKDSESANLHPIDSFKDYSKHIEHVVGHNIINYDERALRKTGVLPEGFPVKNMTDTMLLSQISEPKRSGGHGLMSWGMRFEDYKGNWDDFSQFSWDMVSYCVQDVRVTSKLYDYMLKNTKNFSKFSIRLEHAIRRILDEMEENGFALDIERAHILYVEIKNYCDTLEKEIQKEFPPEKDYFKKLYPRVSSKGVIHGQDAKTIASNLHDVEVDEFGATYYHLYRMVSFNPRSTPQIVERMNRLGWKPVVFNNPTDAVLFKSVCDFLKLDPKDYNREKDYNRLLKKAENNGFDVSEIKGSPKVTEENFESLPKDAPKSARTIAEWFLYDKRLQKLDEWFRNYNEKTKCVHGKVYGIGASTHRMTHDRPNMANISRVVMKKNDEGVDELVWGKESKYSTDMRACWISRDPKNRCLVGVDLSGIQLRAFSYYADSQEYTDLIIKGDIHTYNKDIILEIIDKYCETEGIDKTRVTFLNVSPKEQRNFVKTFTYALLLGAGQKKTGSIFEFPEEYQQAAGKHIQTEFTKRVEGLQEIDKKKNKWAKDGYMVGLDGRLISIPSKHFSLSVALQSFEAITMKYAMVLADRKIKERNLDALLVVQCHDEVQYDCKREHAEELGKLVVEAMEEAGSYFQKKVPITGEAKSGVNNWAESH